MKIKYKTLKKVFHSNNPKEYEKLYNDRINSEQSIEIEFSYHHSKLFFIHTLEISNLLYDILKLNTQILTLDLPNIAIEQFKIKSLINEIIDTNAIEGIRSTKKDITDIIDNPSNTNKKYYYLINHFLKMNYSIKSNDFNIRTCVDVRKLFDGLLFNEIKKTELPDGEYFRKEIVNIVDGKKILHNGLHPETKIISAVDEAINILNNNDINELIRLIIFHYLFGYIHPFYDGNGRLDRFITSCYLGKILNPIVPFRLSYTIKNNLKQYYKAFEEANHELNKGDLTYFIEVFLLIIKEALEKLFASLYDRNKQLYYYYNLLLNSSLKDKDKEVISIMIQSELFSDDGISVKDIVEYTTQTKTTIYKKIASLNEKQLIKQQGKKYGLYLEILEKYLKENTEDK